MVDKPKLFLWLWRRDKLDCRCMRALRSTIFFRVMSMRGLGAREEAIEASGCLGRSDEPRPPEVRAVDCSRLYGPSWAALLARGEAAPMVTEYEKALLVLKEHDYAKMPERFHLMQLSEVCTSRENKNSTSAACTQVDKSLMSALVGFRSELLGLREELLGTEESNSEVGYLRNIVTIQAALIKEQQEQLYEKDREVHSVRREREQYEARLERMERRLAISQKQKQVETLAESQSNSTPKQRLSRDVTNCETEPLPKIRIRNSTERSSTRSRSSSLTGTPVYSDEITGSSRRLKRRCNAETTENGTKPQKKRSLLSCNEIRTSIHYRGLGIDELKQSQNDSLMSNSIVPDSSVGGGSDNPGHSGGLEFTGEITVPFWSVHQTRNALLPSTQDDASEDISDEAFHKRHKKLEEDEKRRKRWDLQRMRTLHSHQELLRKYNKKAGAQKQSRDTPSSKDRVTSFLPKLEDLNMIAVVDSLPVLAFGKPLPRIKQSEFSLPWFDVEAREAKENTRATRRSGRTAINSSFRGSAADAET